MAITKMGRDFKITAREDRAAYVALKSLRDPIEKAQLADAIRTFPQWHRDAIVEIQQQLPQITLGDVMPLGFLDRAEQFGHAAPRFAAAVLAQLELARAMAECGNSDGIVTDGDLKATVSLMTEGYYNFRLHHD